MQTIKFEELKGMIATDQTGRYPLTSRRGNAYIVVLYDFDSNAILATGIRSRKSTNFVDGYDELYDELKAARRKPKLHKLDNDASKELIKSIEEKDKLIQELRMRIRDMLLISEQHRDILGAEITDRKRLQQEVKDLKVQMSEYLSVRVDSTRKSGA